MHYASFRQITKMLGQLDKWLETAAAHATAHSFDSKNFLGLRIAVDQFPFVRQVQIVCDTAKSGAARLTGKEAPTHADTEQSIEELRTRVQAVVAYLDGFSEKDFENAATQVITQPRWEGKTMTGADFFMEHAQPNFFFHFTHVYALLRHAGVPLGKRSYLGALTMKAPPA